MTVVVNKNLLPYETDFRELVQAFYPYTSVRVVDIDTLNEEKNNQNENDREDDILNLEDLFDDFIIDTNKPRKQVKNEIKRKIYNYLNEKTKISLPWGALTGIRPVNIVTSIIENKKLETWLDKNENIDYAIIKNHLQNEYLVSEKKSIELIDIAKKEIEILNRPDVKNYKDEYSLYVGVPFCKSTCLYCSFTSYDINKNKKNVPLYLSALKKEFNDRKLEKSPLTIYVGGGTPTSLNEEDFETFLKILDENIDKKNTIEYTVEAGRPDTITEEKLRLMKKYGVTRISINPQTFSQKTLDLIGRKHTVEDICEKYNLSNDKYIKNINMDLIVGLPGEDINDIRHSIEEVLRLNPTSITVHTLALKRAARLNREKDIWLKDSINISDMFDTVLNQIENTKEYYPYYLYRQKNMASNLENIGFAKDGYECVYNIMMMSERHTVLAYGCGGVSKIVKPSEDGTYQVIRDEGYKGLMEYINVGT